ncbi:sensor histidine kinase [Anaerovorax odorimutans]|uniref:histidine kinase n=1 Tax=Anaerovorax odorimutans TaxID=109327 RepID=A0ABT1RNZ5_9FIRM|nr:ATP-binding protein [Anaerovorax odorimutans]MCQ4636641.1 sensor histidine kinase [Anaerovorax odorimutans]
MSKPVLKIIGLITLFSMTVAFVIGSIVLIRSTDYLTAEIKGKIVSTAENYAHNFSASFNHMEGLTDSLAAHVTTSFDRNRFEADPKGYLRQYKKQLSQMVRETLSTTSTAHSLYVTFNPELTSDNDEVWYAVMDGKIKEISADFKNNKRDFQLPYKEDMAYFFEPQNKDTGIWIGPYFDKDIKQEVFSYSRAIYVGDMFVGVAGADISADDTVNIISRMKLYDSGYSILLDENFQVVVHPEADGRSEEDLLSPSLKKKLEKTRDKKSGIIEYTLDGTDKLLGFSRLDNVWTFMVVQPESEAFAPIDSLTGVLITLGVILAIVLIAFLIVFSMPFLKKQHSLEEENREKDIMLIYQSRQAKTGEMMGNITHQWKQPLNTINLILANLLDSYRFGDLDEARLQKSVSKVENIVERMSETITDFSDFLKPSKEKIPFDVRDCVKTALSLMEESINYHRITVSVSYDGDTTTFGYPNELTHVIFNLLNNARDAIVEAVPAQREIAIQVSEDTGFLEITITNTGGQISPENAPRLFEPYFTTKEASGGTGLGLYISRQIIEQRMGGSLQLKNVPHGVCCLIRIPCAGTIKEE